jgi:hypothetical protein
LVLSKIVEKLDIGTSSSQTITYDADAGLNLVPPEPLPGGKVRDCRAYRKDEDDSSPWAVFASLPGSDIVADHDSFRTEILLPLFFVPFVSGLPHQPSEYEFWQIAFTLAPDPYAGGNSLRLKNCTVQAGYRAPQPPTTIIGASADTIENVFQVATANNAPLTFSFQVFGSTVNPVPFETDNLLAAALKLHASDRVVFTATTNQFGPQMGLDFFARPIDVGRPGSDSFISFGVQFGANTDASVDPPSISFEICSKPFELPIDDGIHIRMFQSPTLIDSSPPAAGAPWPAEWILEITDLPADAFAKFWNDYVAGPHLAAIDTIDAARGLSFMPTFAASAGQDNGRFGFSWLVEQKDRSSRSFDNFAIKRFIGVFSVDGKKSFNANATFPQLYGRDGKPLERSVDVSLTSPFIKDDLYKTLNDGGIPNLAISLQAGSVPAAQSTIVRIGALDLTFGLDGPTGTIELDVESLITGRRAPHVAINIEQGLSHVTPGGQDPVPDSQLADDILSNKERAPGTKDPTTASFLDAVSRASPIVAAEGKLSVDNNTVLLLDGEEMTDAQRSRSVVVRLRALQTRSVTPPPTKSTPAPPPLRVIIIDPEPFLIAAVDVPPLLDAAEFGDDTDGEFAVYRMSEATGEGWSLSNIPNGFDLYLPPQGVGEAMEKGAPWPPITDDNNPTTIDYRFSPTARLWLADTARQQRYAEAPWNLRRRFGSPEDTTPGSQVAGMRAEFLYGLAMQMRGDFLRVAELGARIGALQSNLAAIEPPADESPAKTLRRSVYSNYRDLWAHIGKAYHNRLAYLEPWQEGTAGPLVVEDGAAFLLRVLPDDPANGYFAANMRSPLDTTLNSPDQLAGGATWAFYSANLYNDTIKNRHSTGGRIIAPAFSALGGFGKFTGEFAQGKTRIGAEVSLGRTHRYVVERLGRIGMLWNRAKYVIVYERTVLPTHQMSGSGVPVHQGRPVVRIVEEYVELLQPTRTFADADSPPVRRGPVEASVFKTVKIPVNGRAWGHDIPEGWVVPLWRTDADQSVYPKPSIGVQVTATTDAAEPSLLAIATEPDRLLFFTSTRNEDGANTDLWAPVLNVDYVNAPRPAGLGSIASNSADLDQPVADDTLEDPALATVTIPIDTGGRHVRLSAGRITEDGLGAELHNVTLMRAAPASSSPPKAPPSTAVVGGGSTTPDPAAIGDLQSQVAAVPRALAAGKALLAALPDDLAAIARANIVSAINQPPDAWKQTLKDAIHVEATRATGQINDLVDTATATLEQVASKPDQWIASGTQACAAEAARLSDRIKTAAAQLDQALDSAQDAVLKDIDALQGNWASINAAVQSNFAVVQLAIGSVWSQYDAVLGLVDATENSGLPKIKVAILNSIVAEANRLDNAVAEIQAQTTGITDAGINFVAAINQSGNMVVDRVSTLLESVPARARTLASIGTGVDAARALSDARLALNTFAATARKDINAAAGNAASIAGVLKTQIDDALTSRDPTNPYPSLTTRVDNLLTAIIACLQKSIDDATSALKAPPAQQALSNIQNFVATLDNEVKNLLDQFHGAFPSAAAAKMAVTTAVAAMKGTINSVSRVGTDLISQIANAFCSVVTNVVDAVATSTGIATVVQDLENQLAAFKSAAGQAIQAAELWADDLIDSLADQADQAQTQFAQAISSLTGGFAQQAASIADDLQDGLAEGLGRVATTPTFQDPESTLNLIRAAGQSPLLPNFTFNRDRIAYIYDDFQEAVRTSPMVGLVNRVGDDLKALGLRVPTEELAERIIPKELQNFDISKIFPDLAGFKLDGLFSGIKLPQIAQDTVIVTHGFDRASQSAWLKASSNVPLSSAVDVFNFGPLTLSILSGNFTAQEDVVATLKGPPRSTANAQIVGDWQLGFSGIELVTFLQTRIAYDSTSGLTVNISPQRIRMDAAIQFLSDMIKGLSDPDSGLILELDRDDNGNPIGVRAGLDLPLPPVAAGAFAASGLRLAASTALTVVDGKFSVEVAAALGRPDEPFTLMVMFLNGGGYLTASSKYTPGTPSPISAEVAVAIVAGVGADFTFGVARGAVYVQVGVQATFITPGSGLTLEVFLLVRGGVNILSLISINLVLRLGLIYNSSDGSADASGHISVSIKISIFFTMHVDVPVHYHLAGGGGGSMIDSALLIAGSEPPSAYLDLFA